MDCLSQIHLKDMMNFKKKCHINLRVAGYFLCRVYTGHRKAIKRENEEVFSATAS